MEMGMEIGMAMGMEIGMAMGNWEYGGRCEGAKVVPGRGE